MSQTVIYSSEFSPNSRNHLSPHLLIPPLRILLVLKNLHLRTSLVAQWLRLYAPKAGVPGSTLGQGTISHMTLLKSPYATTKTQGSQTNKIQILKKKLHLQSRNRLTEKREQASGYHWGNNGRDRMGCGNKTLKPTGYKLNNQQGLTAQHHELFSIFCNNLNGEKIWERLDTCITESLCCIPESNTMLFINYVCVLSRFSHVQRCKPVDHRPPGSSVRGISRQEHWNEWPCPPAGDLPDPGIKLASLSSPALAGGFFTHLGRLNQSYSSNIK